MPGIDRMVLISSTGICLKVAFDLNFNLQNWGWRKKGTYSFFLFFQRHNKMSCLSDTIYSLMGGGSHQAANVAIPGICLGTTTKRELLPSPWGELLLLLLKQPARPLQRTIA